MAAKKVGNLIKKARTEADMTQEQLAKKVSGLTASDISKAERGEKELTTDQLKAVAKALGITQKSLLDAAGSSSSSGKTTSGKSSTGKTTSGKSSTGKTSTGKTGSASSSSATTSMKLTAAEKKLVEQYRKADASTKKSVMNLLKGESVSGAESMLKDMLGSTISQMIKQQLK